MGFGDGALPDNHLLSDTGKLYWAEVLQKLEQDDQIDKVIGLACKVVDEQRLALKPNVRKSSPQWASLTKSSAAAMRANA